jgi:hypothetical protein
MSNKIRAIVLAGIATSCPFTVTAAAAPVDEVMHWNQVATDATAAAHTDPLTESRLFATLHVAMHDAINGVEPRYELYLSAGSATPETHGASAPAAAAVAAHDTLVALFPAGREAFDAALASSLAAAGSGSEAERGVAEGRAVARAVLARRGADGSARTVSYAPGTKAGSYRPTPPDLTPAWAAQWGEVTPFALRSPSQFRPGPPPAVDSARAVADVAVVRSVGAQERSSRSDEQSEIARYWYENSTQGWNRIARTVAAAHGLDLHERARLFALLNMALADGYVAVFDAKYHYAYWRPVTAIRAAGDSGWLSYLATPPIPDYPSGHTVEGAAAAALLARFFGTDFVTFRMVSGDPYPGIERGFWSFSEAAHENGASRVLAGIHFPTAVEVGYAQGTSVGTWVFEHALRPLESGNAPAASRTIASRR